MGSEVLSKRLVVGCPFDFEGYQLSANLMILDMDDFDYIIGIDLLTTYRAIVDCYQRFFQFRPEDGEAWYFYESGGEGYIIYAIDASLEGPDIQEIPVAREFPEILRERQLYAKLSKCDFWIYRVVFLGHVISRDDVLVDPSNTKTILIWSHPTIVAEIRSFLWMSDYYRRFVENFSQIAKSLTQLTKKYVPFVWTSECEEIFHELRLRLTTTSILALSSGSEECCSLRYVFRHNKEQQGVCVSSILFKPALCTRIRESQAADLKTQKLARLDQDGVTYGFHLQNDGLLCLYEHVVVPDDSTLQEEILSQDHRSRFSVHPGSMKMYKDIHMRFWWKGIKHNVYQFVSRFLVCQNCDAIWVVVDRLSKFAHFLPYNGTLLST
ncbi:uncharacterized protein [Henckelia pumila]|uniref:uncharacterized protein n=1 Tax=Henckelia pumila TaxID=405737 RepID=UPI003C6E20AC